MRPKFGMSIAPHVSIEDQIRLAVLCERLGYDACWWPDHLLFTDQASSIDSWTIMAAVAVKTRRIVMGTAVSDPHRIHPAVFAQRAATLDQLSKGRLVVGLGSGEAMNLDAFGIAWKDRKVGRMREFIQVFRGLLDSDRPFTFEGSFYRLKNAKLSVRPYQNRKLPLHLASLGPQMQQLAGQVADGWKPVVIPAQYYPKYFEGIARAAREAGRDPHEIDRGTPFPIAVFEGGKYPTPQQVSQAVRPFAGSLIWEPAIRQMGIPFEPPAHLGDAGYHTVDPCDEESMSRFEQYKKWLPDDLLHQFVIYGDRGTIRQAVRRYLDAGVTNFEITNASPDPLPSIVWFAHQVIPEFTGRPPTAFARMLNALLKPLSRLGLTRKLVPADLDLWKKVGL